MRTIAHVAAPARFGGLESVVAGLCRAMAERGNRVVLILVLDEGADMPLWAGALAPFGVLLEPVRVPARAYLSERRVVRGLLRKHGAEVVHTHGYRADVVHAGVALAERLPLVSTAHGFATTRGVGLVYEWLQMRAWRRFDAVVAVSRPLVETLVAAGVPRERIVLIRNGLTSRALVSREAARAKLGIPPELPVIGWVGRFSEEKAPLLAIDAFARATERRSRLCMLGDGPLLSAARTRATAAGLGDRVMFKGPVPDAWTLFQAFDALLISSTTEGTPMVALEAAAAGIPVIATAVGGLPDLIGGEGGWLVRSGDARAISEAIAVVLSDPGEVSRRTRQLREAVSGANDEGDWVEQYLLLYERIVA